MTEMIFCRRLLEDIDVYLKRYKNPAKLATSHPLTPFQPAQSHEVGFLGRLSLHAHTALWLKVIKAMSPSNMKAVFKAQLTRSVPIFRAPIPTTVFKLLLTSCFKIATVIGKKARSICTHLVS